MRLPGPNGRRHRKGEGHDAEHDEEADFQHCVAEGERQEKRDERRRPSEDGGAARRPVGVVPRDDFEKANWPAVKNKIFEEATEIFLRLLRGDVLSSEMVASRSIDGTPARAALGLPEPEDRPAGAAHGPAAAIDRLARPASAGVPTATSRDSTSPTCSQFLKVTTEMKIESGN